MTKKVVNRKIEIRIRIPSLLFTPTPITPLIGVEPVQLWGQRDCPSPKATLNGQSLLQFTPLSNKNFAKTGVGVNQCH